MRRIYLAMVCLLLAALFVPAVVLAEASETPKKAPAAGARKAPAHKAPAAGAAKAPEKAAAGATPAEAPARPPAGISGKAGTPGMPLEKPGTAAETSSPGPGETAGAAPAGKSAEAAGTGPSKPFAGYINADVVNIRSGPGLYFYPVTTVKQGTPVSVEQRIDEWAAIKPVEGSFGLMKKSDLEVATDNVTATVTAPAARVYASGEAAKRDWCVLKTLKQGDKVKVLGPAEDDRVKVALPEGCCVYVLASYVAQGPSPKAATTKEPKYAILETEVKPPEPDPEYDEYKSAEAALAEEMKRPMAERDYKTLLARFKDIAEKASKDYLKRAGAARLSYLQTLSDQQADYLKVVKLGEELNKSLADSEARRVMNASEAETKKSSAKPPFAATGVVEPLLAVEGAENPAAKYKLVDAKGNLVVLLRSNTYKLEDYVGKAIGVRGVKTYVKEWNMNLVTVDDLEPLE